jgi:hypothetical protein
MPCTYNPQEITWGEIAPNKVICRCRNQKCRLFSECRNGLKKITKAQRDIWVDNKQDMEALNRFDEIYQQCQKKQSQFLPKVGKIREEFAMPPAPNPTLPNPSAPKWTDEEEFL